MSAETGGNTALSTPRGEAVRDRLLDAAERLFAEGGIDAVSMSAVGRLANQRNGSVIQYHFGSKERLIAAILERRMEALNARRLELLAVVDVRDRRRALAQIARAIVLPIAEHLSASDSGSHYIRFVAQVTFNAQKSIFEIVRGSHDSGVREIAELAKSILPELPPEVLRHRLALVTTLVLFGFGEREKLRMVGKRSGVARLHTMPFVDDLVQMIVAALDAPQA